MTKLLPAGWVLCALFFLRRAHFPALQRFLREAQSLRGKEGEKAATLAPPSGGVFLSVVSSGGRHDNHTKSAAHARVGGWGEWCYTRRSHTTAIFLFCIFPSSMDPLALPLPPPFSSHNRQQMCCDGSRWIVPKGGHVIRATRRTQGGGVGEVRGVRCGERKKSEAGENHLASQTVLAFSFKKYGTRVCGGGLRWSLSFVNLRQFSANSTGNAPKCTDDHPVAKTLCV